MTPIQKDGDTMNLENYRGVVVQNGFGQVGERIFKDQLQSHMLKCQHGFLKNRSTLTNLMETVQKFNDVLDDGGQVDAVYFDVSKAFDKVPHSLLLEKCKAYRLSDAIINLLRTYLLNRAYQVRLNRLVLGVC
ncbi:uncharacterized protein LOC129717052 [Wyeomyia smithii]|uniref:uncharacterized protein LOC129717052 n=1 Tax=Wyeomyia smithii TaxID=174621 RepID=UPI00246816B8|nr:uncharacterized protein LOC129717052 [Wyeomyia smithii]